MLAPSSHRAERNAFCGWKFVFELHQISAERLIIAVFNAWILTAVPLNSHESDRTYRFPPPLLLSSYLVKVEHGSIFFFIYITRSEVCSCSVRSANKPQWGGGIYFANISIKWSVKVRLGRRQGWGEARELTGCGQGASAFTLALSAFSSGREQGECWGGGGASGVLINLRAQKESFLKF